MGTLTQKLDLDEFNDSILNESTLLYVEDNDEERSNASEVFKQVFKNVLVVNNGKEALELYANNTVDIILTDLEMPTMNGIEFMSGIRKVNWSVPILVTTELENLSVLPQVIKLKVANYIFKPMLLKTTLKIMLEILQQISHIAILEKQQQELGQFKTIIDNQSLVSETDLTGKIIYANKMFCDVSGYTKEELLGQPHNIIRHPSVSPRIFAQLWNTIQAGKVWSGKIKNRAKDGSDYHVKATIFPILNSKGEIVKFMASRYLITDKSLKNKNLKNILCHKEVKKSKVIKTIKKYFKLK